MAVSLSVNGSPVAANFFVERFIEQTVSGMVGSLEGTGRVRELKLSIDGDAVSLYLNGAEVSINEFVAKMFRSTTLGMLAPLKGTADPKKVQIAIKTVETE